MCILSIVLTISVAFNSCYGADATNKTGYSFVKKTINIPTTFPFQKKKPKEIKATETVSPGANFKTSDDLFILQIIETPSQKNDPFVINNKGKEFIFNLKKYCPDGEIEHTELELDKFSLRFSIANSGGAASKCAESATPEAVIDVAKEADWLNYKI